MGRIHVLDELTYAKIAAGEVVDRPSSIVKELVENSIDSGASRITVDLENGGTTLIRVSDNGSGMDRGDAVIAFLRHATSKIHTIDDIDTLTSLGFRGEALASIAAVSKVEMLTRIREDLSGTRLLIKGGNIEDSSDAGCPAGTTITVTELFYNTPARYKFLKRDSTETGYAVEMTARLALGSPDISFILNCNGREVLRTPGDSDLRNVIYSIYGREIANNITEMEYFDKGINISGFTGKRGTERANRNNQSFFVNGRYFKSRSLSAAVDEAYKPYLEKGKYAFVILKMNIRQDLTDVNVHPQKMEIRFSDESDVFRKVYHAISNTLKGVFEPQSVVFSHDSDASLVRESPLQNLWEPAPSQENTVQPVFKGVRILGQAFSTFLLVEKEDILYIIDQHAAHERILYEKLKNGRTEPETLSQALLAPLVIQLSPAEASTAFEQIDHFQRFGFRYDDFGNNSLLIRAAPYLTHGENPGDVFKYLLDCMAEDDLKKNDIEKITYGLACRMAVKAADVLHEDEIAYLLKDLDALNNPATCPHGRPFVAAISKIELAKLFGRKQGKSLG